MENQSRGGMLKRHTVNRGNVKKIPRSRFSATQAVNAKFLVAPVFGEKVCSSTGFPTCAKKIWTGQAG